MVEHSPKILASEAKANPPPAQSWSSVVEEDLLSLLSREKECLSF